MTQQPTPKPAGGLATLFRTDENGLRHDSAEHAARTPGKPQARMPIVDPGQLPDGVPSRIGKTQVGAIAPKTLLSPGSGFISSYDYVLNPYAGCSFGCQYCYASNFSRTEEQKRLWGQWVQIKTNAVEQMANTREGILNGKTVYMSTVTDPYQPVEQTAQVVRGILEAMLAKHPEVKLVVQTRSTMVTRDIDLFTGIVEAGGRVQVNMSLTTDDDEVRKIYEPGCSSVAARTKAILEVQEAGVQTCVTMTPMLPMKNAGSFVRMLLASGIRRFICQPLRYPDQDQGRMIAQTDERALESAVEYFRTESKAEAVHLYQAAYLKDYRTIRDVLQQEPGCTLGQGQKGFEPPF